MEAPIKGSINSYCFYFNICHNIGMNKYFILSISTIAVFFILAAAPITASAQTNFATYQPRTEAERIAYLYGRISQLLDIQAQLQNGGNVAAVENQLSFDYVSVDTHRAVEIEATTAVLRGEVELFGEATASAWFEYGEDKDFLDQRTTKKSIRSAYERAVRIKVSGLEEEEVYYFRIVTLNKDKTVSYGPIYTFRTDEDED
jgi:hypothetical protein